MPRLPLTSWMLTIAAAAALVAPIANAFDPFLVTPEPSVATASPAYRYANMRGDQALAELRSRSVLFQEQPPTRGVDTPIRLTSRLAGVHFHSMLPDAQRATTPFEICDARFALALYDFATILAKHDIEEVVHYSMYRPGAPPAARPLPSSAPPPLPRSLPPASAPLVAGPGRPKRTAQSPPLPPPADPAHPVTVTTRPRTGTASHPSSRPIAAAAARPTPPQAAGGESHTSRHPAGLAIDVAMLKKKSGEWLNVLAQFDGKIGAQTCGPDVPTHPNDQARELRAIVCEAFDAKVFTYVLTPNYNAPHRDHFHMEIKPGVRWFLYH